MRHLFGTDGVRGIANRYPMTAEVVVRLGQAVALYFRHKDRRTRILVGKDTRLSGYFFESALAAGITSVGADVMFVGPLPTPGIAFLTQSMRADAGMVISASHNPYQDNGIKIFGADGFKLPDEVELELERLILANDPQAAQRLSFEEDPLTRDLHPERIGRARRYEDAAGRYIVHMKNAFPSNLRLDGLKIVVDCAHGAAYKVAPAALEELGAELVVLGNQPDGTNINENCGSLHPRYAAAKVLENNADLGITLDGDHILAMSAIELARQQRLHANTVVSTVMSNLGLEVALKRQGLKLERTQVGDRYVVERMRAEGFNLGGEQSGHVIFLDHASTGDGMVAALQVLGQLQRTQKPLSELCKVMESFPQTLVNLKVARKPPIEELPHVVEAIRAAETALGDEGRVLVRYSGTEAKARVMVEGPDSSIIERHAQAIAAAMREAIGA